MKNIKSKTAREQVRVIISTYLIEIFRRLFTGDGSKVILLEYYGSYSTAETQENSFANFPNQGETTTTLKAKLAS